MPSGTFITQLRSLKYITNTYYTIFKKKIVEQKKNPQTMPIVKKLITTTM